MRQKPILITALLFFILALSTAPSAAELPITKKIAPRVYAYIGGGGTTNSGFVITGKGVVLIDSQGPLERVTELKLSISARTRLPVIYTINTHYHGDHTFGNQYFAGKIISHKKAREDLALNDKEHRERFKKFFGPASLEGFRLTLPEITFTDELHLYAGTEHVIITHSGPAHTSGDAYVYLPDERVVFTGDILYKGRLPWLGEGSVTGNLKALDELLDLEADIYVPGHGDVATREDVRLYKKYLLDLTEEVKRLMAEGKTMKEISAATRLPAYSDYDKYKEWLPLNAAAVYRELKETDIKKAK